MDARKKAFDITAEDRVSTGSGGQTEDAATKRPGILMWSLEVEFDEFWAAVGAVMSEGWAAPTLSKCPEKHRFLSKIVCKRDRRVVERSGSVLPRRYWGP